MLTRLQRLIVFLIVAVPIVTMVIWMGFYISGQVARVTANLAPIAVQELARQINREVEIGKIRITSSNTAVITDIRISEGRTFATGTLLTAERVVVHFDLRGLLFGGQGLSAVSSIEVIDPTVLLVRRRNGTFNITDLFQRPPGPKRPPFTGTVTVTGGKVIFRDYLARTPLLPATATLYNVDAVFSAASAPEYAFRVSATGGRGEFSHLRAVGTYSVTSKVARVDVTGRDVDAPFAVVFAPFLGSIRVAGGALTPSLGITARKVGGRWVTAAAGVVGIRNGIVSLPGMLEPARQVTGTVVLAKDQAAMDLTGTFVGSPISVTGTITNLNKPQLNVLVRAPNIRYGRLIGSLSFLSGLRQATLSGAGPLTARITGPVTSPTVVAEGTIPRATYKGFTATNVHVSATYSRGLVTIHSARGAMAGGTVVASGTAKVTGVPQLDITASAVGIDVARIPISLPQGVTGQVSAEIRITGTTANPVVTATATLTRGTFREIAISAPSAQITYRQGRIEVRGQLVVRIAGGVVRLNGLVTPSRIDARYTAQGLNLVQLQKYVNLRGLAGVLYSSGRVTGSTTDPTVTGAAEVFNGRYRDFATDYARIAFTGTRRSVTISEGVARLLPGEITFAGTLSGLQSRRITFQAGLRARRLRVDQVLALLDQRLDVTGTLAGEFTVSGAYLTRVPAGANPLVDAVASGTLRLEDGTAFGFPISSANMALSYAGNVLTITQATAASNGAQVVADGTISTATKQVQISFRLNSFDLARLRDQTREYATLAGTLTASGTITGPYDNVTANFSASVDNLLVNSTRFDQAKFGAVYSGGIVESLTARLARGQQTYELTATGVNVSTECATSAVLSVSNASVPDLWAIATASPFLATERGAELRRAVRTIPRLTSGTLNMTANLSGCIGNPDGSVRLVANDVGFDERRIDSIVVDASAVKGAIMLNEMKAVSGEMYVEATPAEPNTPVYQDGRLQVSLAAYNVDLSRLSPVLGEQTPSGVLTARFDVVGPAERPDVIGSVEVLNPGYGAVVFDRLRASRIEIKDDQISIADVILAANGHQVVARGTLPWSWEDLTIPRDRPLSFTAELQREDLSILSTFTQIVDPATTNGAIQAALDVTGTLADLKLSGLLQVQNGTVGLKGFRNTFTGIDVDMVFDGKRVLVNQFVAQSSLGGSVEIIPGSYIDIGNLETTQLNLLVAARALTISEQNVLGYQEDVVGHVNAGLSVTGSLASPLVADRQIDTLAGGISVYDATLAFAVPENVPQRQPREFAVNPRFDVGVDIGPDVTAKPPRMTILVTGGGMLTGTLGQPNVNLELTIARGNLMLGTAVLRVVPGGTIEVAYAPPEATRLVLRNFQATTSVTATSPLGQRERYQITVRVNGPVGPQMNIDLTSNPPGLSREQMLAAIGHVEGLFATAEGTLQQELANVLTAVGTSTLFAPIERLFVERLGFEQFTLEYSPITPLALFLSRRLFDSFYLSYYQRLTGELVGTSTTAYQIQLSYRFRQLYHISFGVDDQQTTTFQVGYQSAFW